jgi:hypothetical protein
MSTQAPIVCNESWTLIYDGLADGAYSGAIQSSGIAVFSVGAVVPLTLSGFQSHDQPTPISIANTEKLYCRALNGEVTVIIADNFYLPGGGGGGGGGDSNVEVIEIRYIANTAFTGASVGDGITKVRFYDTSVPSAPVITATLWFNETTNLPLASAPNSSDIDEVGAGALTNTELRASPVDVDVTSALPVGSNIIGQIGIDQTTPGTTNKVSIGSDGVVSLQSGSQTLTGISVVGPFNTTAGATSIDVINRGTAAGTFGSVIIEAGDSESFAAAPGKTLLSVSGDATGTTLVYYEVV